VCRPQNYVGGMGMVSGSIIFVGIKLSRVEKVLMGGKNLMHILKHGQTMLQNNEFAIISPQFNHNSIISSAKNLKL
jgi:hypothetical protein